MWKHLTRAVIITDLASSKDYAKWNENYSTKVINLNNDKLSKCGV